MKLTRRKLIEWFLRLALSAGFLSAVADRFGWWSKANSAWGNWPSFVAYTQTLIPFVPAALVPLAAAAATALEILLGLGLLVNYRTAAVAKASGLLLLLFALAMTGFKTIKAPLDYSVYTASAAAFALSALLAVENRFR